MPQDNYRTGLSHGYGAPLRYHAEAGPDYSAREYERRVIQANSSFRALTDNRPVWSSKHAQREATTLATYFDQRRLGCDRDAEEVLSRRLQAIMHREKAGNWSMASHMESLLTHAEDGVPEVMIAAQKARDREARARRYVAVAEEDESDDDASDRAKKGNRR